MMLIFVLKLILAFVLGYKLGELGRSKGWPTLLTILVFIAAWLGINLFLGLFGL